MKLFNDEYGTGRQMHIVRLNTTNNSGSKAHHRIKATTMLDWADPQSRYGAHLSQLLRARP